MKFKIIDLCAGIGGIRKGFEMTGNYQCVLSAEIDKFACNVYEYLYKNNPFNDITTIDFKEKIKKTKYDVLLAGFPCQSFSIAGKQMGFLDETRGTIFFDIYEILKISKPKAFLLENVGGLIRHEKGTTLKIILETLINKLDYKIVNVEKNDKGDLVYNPLDFIRDAKNFGLPQKRSRTYIMGFRNNIIPTNYIFPEIPKKSNNKIFKNLYDLIEKNVSDKYYLSEQLLTTLKNHKTIHKNKKNGFGYVVVNTGNVPIANTILATGGSGKERNLILQSKKEYIDNSYSKKGPINIEGIRYMTPVEWGRLQGFIGYAFVKNKIDNFSFPEGISDTQKYKLFGNSVAIPVIESLAIYMFERMEEFYGFK